MASSVLSATAGGGLSSDNVKVCVRVRPLTTGDSSWAVGTGGSQTLSATDVKGKTTTSYGFDHVFDERTTSRDVFDSTVRDMVRSVVDGYNGTVFTYGQTAAGKTHTMQGDKRQPGVLPLTINEIMECISHAPDRAFLIRCSYVEIYKETITDLLADKTVEVHEDKKKGIYVDAREEVIANADEILACLAKGEEHRHVGKTGMNERSSRSHTIFRIVVESRAIDSTGTGTGNVTMGILNLVDLAGSESVRTSQATGERLHEAKAINTSLLALSRVIKDLAEQGKSLNYRQSKLTRVLQPSLAGNTKLTVICCINPSRAYLEESKTTLEFAVHAKGIRVAAGVNTVAEEGARMKVMEKELAALRDQLKQLEAAKEKAAAMPASSAAAVSTAMAGPLPMLSDITNLAAVAAGGVAGIALEGKSAEEVAAHYEAQLASMRARMFIGGTKQAEVTRTGFADLGRIRSFEAQQHKAALGRGKRHRETWCPSGAGTRAGEAGVSTGLRKSFLADINSKRAGGKGAAAAIPASSSMAEEEEEEDCENVADDEADDEEGSLIDDAEPADDDGVVSFKPRIPSAKIGKPDCASTVQEAMAAAVAAVQDEDEVGEEGNALGRARALSPLPPAGGTASAGTIASMHAELGGLRAAVSDKEASLSSLHAEYELLLQRNEEVEAELSRIVESETALGKEVSALSDALETERAAREEEAGRVALLQAAVKTAEIAAESAATSSSVRLSDMLEQAASASQVVIQALQADAATLVQQLAQAHAIIASSKNEAVALAAAAAEEAAASAACVVSLKAECEALRASLADVEATRAMESMRSEEALLEKEGEVFALVAAHDVALTALRADLTAGFETGKLALTRELEVTQAALEALQATLSASAESSAVSIASLESAVASLTLDLASARESAAGTSASLVSAKTQHEDLQAEFAALKARANALQDELQATSADGASRVAAAAATLESGAREVCTLKASVGRAVAERDNALAKIGEMEGSLSAARCESDKRQRALEASTFHCTSLEEDVRALEESIAALEAVETRLTTQLADAKAEAVAAEERACIAGEDMKLAALSIEYAQQTAGEEAAAKAEALAALTDLTMAKVGVEQELEEIKAKCEGLQDNLAAATSRMKELEHKVASAQSECEAISAQASKQAELTLQQVTALTEEIALSRAECARVSTTAASLQASLSILEDGGEASAGQVASLTRESANLREALAAAESSSAAYAADLQASSSSLTSSAHALSYLLSLLQAVHATLSPGTGDSYSSVGDTLLHVVDVLTNSAPMDAFQAAVDGVTGHPPYENLKSLVGLTADLSEAFFDLSGRADTLKNRAEAAERAFSEAQEGALNAAFRFEGVSAAYEASLSHASALATERDAAMTRSEVTAAEVMNLTASLTFAAAVAHDLSRAKEEVCSALAVADAALGSRGDGVAKMLAAAQEELSELKCTSMLLKGELESSRAEVAFLKAAAGEAVAAGVEARAEVAGLHSLLEGARACLLPLEDKVRTLEAALSSAAATSASVASSNTDLECALATIASLQGQVREGEGRWGALGGVQEELAAAKSTKARIAGDNAALSLVNTELAGKNAGLERDNAAGRSIVCGLQEGLAAAQAACAAAVAESDGRAAEVVRLGGALSRLGMELASEKAVSERTGFQLASARGDVCGLTARLAEAEEAAATARAGVEEAEARYSARLAGAAAAHAAEVEAMRTEAAEQGSILEAANDALFELRSSLSDADKAVEMLTGREADLSCRMEAAVKRDALLVVALEDARARARTAAGEAAARGAEAHHAEAQCRAWEAHVAGLTAELAAARERISVLDKAKLTTAQLEKMMSIRTQRDVLKGEAAVLRREKAELRAQLASLAGAGVGPGTGASPARDALRTRLADLESSLASSTSARAVLEEKLAEAGGATADAREQAEAAKAEAAACRAATAEARAALQAAQAACARTASAAAVLSATLHSARETVGAIEEGDGGMPLDAFRAPSAGEAAESTLSRASAALTALLSRVSALSTQAHALQAAHAAHVVSAGARAGALEEEADALRVELGTAREALESLRGAVGAANEALAVQRSHTAQLDRALSHAQDRAAYMEKAGAEEEARARNKVRQAQEAAAGAARQMQFLEKENLQLMMEARALRATVGGGTGGGGAGGPSMASAQGRASVYIKPGVGVGRASLAPSQLTGRASLAPASMASSSTGRRPLGSLQAGTAHNNNAAPAPDATTAVKVHALQQAAAAAHTQAPAPQAAPPAPALTGDEPGDCNQQ